MSSAHCRSFCCWGSWVEQLWACSALEPSCVGTADKDDRRRFERVEFGTAGLCRTRVHRTRVRRGAVGRSTVGRSKVDRSKVDRFTGGRAKIDRRAVYGGSPLMLADFPVLYVDVIVRRTLGSCIVLGVVAVLASIVLGQPLAGVGIVLGLAGATVNHRLFQVSTVRYSSTEGHMDRKPYAGSVAARLGGITVVAFALLYFVRPMGFGMVAGLVAFQVLLMANALGALWRYQRLQLAGLAPTDAGKPGQVGSPPPSNDGPDGNGPDRNGPDRNGPDRKGIVPSSDGEGDVHA